ncbi:MAG TPA: nuclear transport factor 2 family protein [Chitinophagaceae bacterium]|nr:nuclear transport factor 2 family protein [Chitinophagaceae bacterium]
MKMEKLEYLFQEYEKSFDKLNIEAIAKYYDDTFISAGPKGTIARNKNEFMSKARQASEMYRSIGQNSAKILSKGITQISNEYALVTVHWGVTFEKTGDKITEFDVSYLVRQTGDDTKIVLFISHEDEEEAMKKLGLRPQFSTS